MRIHDKNLADAIMVKFGTAPYEPTVLQLASIKQAITLLDRAATDEEWFDFVAKYCPGAGKHSYARLDNPDLNALLAVALRTTQRKHPSTI